MRYGTAVLILLLLSGEGAMAQGVSQTPTQTVAQQRQSGSTVAGGPNSAVRTNQGVSTGFSSPFASPFGSSNSSQSKGGYAGSGSSR